MSPCNRTGICIRLKIEVLWVRFPPGVPPPKVAKEYEFIQKC